MSTTPPYPTSSPALGLLDLTPTLAQPSATSPTFPCLNLPSLAYLLLADRLAQLYEMTFPDQPQWLSEEVVNWQSQEAIIAAVERFLGRVNTLFPIHDEIWELEEVAPGQVSEVITWRLYEIPIMPMGFDYWYEEWDDYKEPAPYLLHLHHSRQERTYFGRPNTFADQYPDHLLPLQVEPHRLVATLREMKAQHLLPGPLAALPDLIEMLDCNTGNAWLDTGELALADGDGYPRWRAEEVQGLAQEWRQAQPILAQIHELLDWRNGSPDEVRLKLTAVRETLLTAYHRSQGCYQLPLALEMEP